MARTSTLPPKWKALADKVGGVKALADRCGVAPSTLFRWAHGQVPISGPGGILLAQIAEGDVPEPE